MLTPLADSSQRLIVYRAADPVSQAALDRLRPAKSLRAI